MYPDGMVSQLRLRWRIGPVFFLALLVPSVGSDSMKVPRFFTYPWTGGEPSGKYVFFLGAATTGALADGTIEPGEIVAFSTATLVFAP